MSPLLLSRALFDLQPFEREPVPAASITALAIDRALGPGQIALITGPSGAGKSTILRRLRTILRARRHRAIVVDPSRLPQGRTVEVFNSPLPTTLSVLSICGLADAAILERRTDELSAGQQWRLALALALRRTRAPHATLLIDELGSTLDRATAQCLCRTLRRWVHSRPIRAICATHDDSLLESLAPAVLAVQPLHAPATVQVARLSEALA